MRIDSGYRRPALQRVPDAMNPVAPEVALPRHSILRSRPISRRQILLGIVGRFVSLRSLQGGLSDLRHSAPPPEGMTMDRDGNLYVVSEPNLFYKFSKTPK